MHEAVFLLSIGKTGPLIVFYGDHGLSFFHSGYHLLFFFALPQTFKKTFSIILFYGFCAVSYR